MVEAFVALGSNMGERLETLRGARSALDRPPRLAVMASSPLYETAAVGGPAGQGPYLNAVLKVATSLGPSELLEICLGIEERWGRVRRDRWGARTLDLDLLLYGDEIRRGPELVLPHPRLHLRHFVLVPLVDLAPELTHPVLGRSLRELLLSLGPREGVGLFLPTW